MGNKPMLPTVDAVFSVHRGAVGRLFFLEMRIWLPFVAREARSVTVERPGAPGPSCTQGKRSEGERIYGTVFLGAFRCNILTGSFF